MNTMMLVLHGRGYGSIWRTGQLATSLAAHDLLGLEPQERLLGCLDIGTAQQVTPPRRRPVEDLEARVRSLRDLVNGELRPVLR